MELIARSVMSGVCCCTELISPWLTKLFYEHSAIHTDHAASCSHDRGYADILDLLRALWKEPPSDQDIDVASPKALSHC